MEQTAINFIEGDAAWKEPLAHLQDTGLRVFLGSMTRLTVTAHC